jgi:hypothetical protein
VARFVTIGYGDRAGYNRTDPAIRDAAHRHDACLHADGALMGRAGQPAQVRNPDGSGVDTSEGRSALRSVSWRTGVAQDERCGRYAPVPL